MYKVLTLIGLLLFHRENQRAMNIKPSGSKTNIPPRYTRLYQSRLKKQQKENFHTQSQPKSDLGITKLRGRFQSLESFFLINGVLLQSFNIQCHQPTHLKGQFGTEVFIPAQAFRDFNGKIVSGKVSIRLKEIFQQSDMLLSDKPTMAQNSLLETAGILYLNAYQKNMPLRLAQPIQVYIPISQKINNPLAMQVFKGCTSNHNPYSNKASFDWKPSNRSSVKLTNLNHQKVFQLELHELQWVSCNYFYKNKEKSTLITVQTTRPNIPLKDKVAFVVFHHIHSVARLISKPKNFALYNLPMNQAATVFIIGLDEKQQLYFGQHHLMGLSRDIIHIPIAPIREKDLIEECTF